ncbi:hypothetical protein CK203_035724 [Vitis vinifera]|uniref:Uncharacterized protein n=1 Tax=Vitis vinifera TaxID=29760 RepID=A0A438ED26_VITVI|nr:hypothetical protein CK203_084589 [Vitis vinifera]RVW45736.1 hypothetical protein CK203_095004 [Vitis vinifera]RVW84706.1 hypothetical protein CK203_046647 [Vitis vinifera]RVW94454.1 hypothetical protein CK203_035724 [Vitis vinifera]
MHGSFDYQEVTDKLIEENEFDADQKDAFKTMSERQKKPIDRLEKPRKRPCRNELID